jgi:hypothetical protein
VWSDDRPTTELAPEGNKGWCNSINTDLNLLVSLLGYGYVRRREGGAIEVLFG